MKLVPYAANLIWRQSLAPRRRQFARSIEYVELCQERLLMSLLRKNTGTAFGRRHGFDRIGTVADFQRSVPLSSCEDYLPYIEDIASGRGNILTTEPVILFQPTSGSAAASKLIPYTRELKRQFQRAADTWLASIFKQYPGVLHGGAYWCLTPPAQRPAAKGVIPVGFDDDAEYLGSLGRRLFRRVSVLPSSIVQETEIERFLDLTLAHLLAREDLALISVWSPTFLLQLLDRLTRGPERILRLLTDSLLPKGLVGRARLRSLTRLLGDGIDAGGMRRLWPDLALVSCWQDGASRAYAGDVERLLPGVTVQGKGLVATEGIISIPFSPTSDPVLAVESHFFEFQDSETGEISLAEQVEQGQRYSVILTTGGGLYRYRLGDVVEVTGFIGQAPTLRFIARDKVADLFGEKLSEQFVESALTMTLGTASIGSTFRLLAPVSPESGSPCYCLFLATADPSSVDLPRLRETLESRLNQNYHYALCRRLGQLRVADVFLIDPSAGTPGEVYAKEMLRRGQKLGDIKTSLLDVRGGWERLFRRFEPGV